MRFVLFCIPKILRIWLTSVSISHEKSLRNLWPVCFSSCHILRTVVLIKMIDILDEAPLRFPQESAITQGTTTFTLVRISWLVEQIKAFWFVYLTALCNFASNTRREEDYLRDRAWDARVYNGDSCTLRGWDPYMLYLFGSESQVCSSCFPDSHSWAVVDILAADFPFLPVFWACNANVPKVPLWKQ